MVKTNNSSTEKKSTGSKKVIVKKTEKIIIKLKKLTDNAVIPTYAHVNDKTGENEGDICLDLTATSVEWDKDMDCYIYHTGLAIETEKNIGVFLLPRSSNRKKDCYLANSVGTIDSPIYRGELIFCYKPRTSTYMAANNFAVRKFIDTITISLKANIFNVFRLNKIFQKAQNEFSESYDDYITATRNLKFTPYKEGDKIGQMVAFHVNDIQFVLTDTLSETVRGDKGFGSTDVEEKSS